MNCPYCNNEMLKGLIQSPQEISWLKGEKRKMFGRAEFHKDSVVLSTSTTVYGKPTPPTVRSVLRFGSSRAKFFPT